MVTSDNVEMSSKSVAKTVGCHFAHILYFEIIVNETNWLHVQINLTILLFEVEKVWNPKCNG